MSDYELERLDIDSLDWLVLVFLLLLNLARVAIPKLLDKACMCSSEL